MFRTRCRMLFPSGCLHASQRLLKEHGAATASGGGDDGDVDGIAARATQARHEVNKLWNEDKGQALSRQELKKRVDTIVEKFAIKPSTAREDDVTRALGEAFERLIQLHVPLNAATDLPKLNDLLALAGRNNLQISRQCIQSLFVRCTDFTEAITLLHALRSSNVTMDMSTYYTVLYSLQRLEEESWGKKYNEWQRRAASTEGAEGEGESTAVSHDALEFILFGCPNQLLPESKPHLGRVMFADVDVSQQQQQQGRARSDDASVNWVNMYKGDAAA